MNITVTLYNSKIDFAIEGFLRNVSIEDIYIICELKQIDFNNNRIP